MQKKTLENLFQRQFLIGCNCINCNNAHCRSCNDFKHIRLSRAELIEMSRYYAASPKLHKFLCPNLPAIITDPNIRKRLDKFNAWAKDFLNQTDESKIDFPTAIMEINDVSDIFPYALLTNDRPLSDNNDAIDEDVFFNLANKLSTHSEVTAAVTALVFTNAENLNPNLYYYSSIRAFTILFAFPQIYHISVVDEVLTRLIFILANIGPISKRVVEAYFRRNKKLLSNAVSACHLLIQHYISANGDCDPHMAPVLDICRAIKVLFDSNSDSEEPLPNSIFYDYYINQRINVDNELKMDQKLSFVQFPFVLSLVTKYAFCRSQSAELLRSTASSTGSSLDPFYTIRIRKDHFLEDASKQIMQQNPNIYLRMIKVVFDNEPEYEIGGPSRQFFYMLSNQLFSPELGLFERCEENNLLWFNPNSSKDPQIYQLAGTIVGLAIYNAVLLPILFPYVLYKKIQNPNINLSIHDLSQVDPAASRSLFYMVMMRARGQDIMQLEITFDITTQINGKISTFSLKKGQEDLLVTNKSLDEYIQLYLNYRMNASVKRQFDAFAKGFKQVCKAPIYSKLEPSELGILVSGEEAVEWSELRNNCEYKGGYTNESDQVKWFWDLFENEFTVDDKKIFLKFITGTDRAPLGGLEKVKIVMQKVESTDELPSSKISANIFILPCYQSKEEMVNKLKTAIFKK
ncbi:Ubiquitin-protein ligase E3A [Tritrichomonas musculus]|uniref:HECT-type E3 ubiquitin transferase n=1 Tax=Tritrichomonas musculus TaxID=1915356 RepID=A0ABR2K7T0_9EUKA